MAHDVFVSHASQDKVIADAIVTALETGKISCWIPPRDITPDSSWGEAIINAIKSSRIMVIIFSGNSNRSSQVLREVELAVANKMILVVFRIENISPFGALAYYLSSVYWMDALTNNLDAHLDKLINIIKDYQKVNDEPTEEQSDIVSREDSTHIRNRLKELFGQKKKDAYLTNHISNESIDVNRAGQLQVHDTIEVKSAKSQGLIRFCIGDLTNLSSDDAVDVLIIWSVRDNYSLIPGSFINALDQKGISIESLAMDKEVDLRQAFSCWLSREIKKTHPGIAFNRILCFEPDESAKAGELVGDIFRSLAPFLGGSFPIRTVSTGLLASGRLMKNKKVMLQQLVEAAVHWMSSGLPLDCLNIVSLPDSRIDELTQLFSELKSRFAATTAEKQNQFSYDFFISYSHKDTREVDLFMEFLLAQNKGLRIFIDKKNLNPGSAWQHEIYEAIDDCRKVATFYSPTYLDSKVCIEEFNIALCRHRESDEPILKPIYLYSANLPTYMRLVQFFDCRESNPEKIKQAANYLLQDVL